MIMLPCDATKLYKKDSKGKIRIWEGVVEGDEVVTFTGLIDGKLKEERRRAKPKNVGKANETTSQEQAKLELISKASRERDKGYFDTIAEAETTIVVLPMLAHKYKERKKHIKFPCMVQPKINGVRCTVKLYGGPIDMRTRKGKEFPRFSNLLADLECISEEGRVSHPIYLDGEMHSDLCTFQELVGHCRRMKPKIGTEQILESVKLRVFDCFTPCNLDASFMSRWSTINKIVGDHRDMVELVETTICNSEEEIFALHRRYLAEGYEGTIIRNMTAPYALNSRSNDLQKYKEFFDDEYEIVGGVEGEGRDEGTVVWICKTPSGKEFKVRPKGVYEQRKEWFDNLSQYIGKQLTVRYQDFTDDGIPHFGVGIAIRDYE